MAVIVHRDLLETKLIILVSVPLGSFTRLPQGISRQESVKYAQT